MSQMAIPVDVSPTEVLRKQTFGAAIDLCLEVAGLEPKQVQHALHLDKAQYSRWVSGNEGIIWPKLQSVMDLCGNDVPVLWQMARRGYDLHSVRRVESEVERQNRQLREENAALRRVLQQPHPVH